MRYVAHGDERHPWYELTDEDRAALSVVRPQGEDGLDREELIDLIADAISDSMDMDWSYRDGARAVVAALIEEGVVKIAPQALAEAEGAQQNETDGAHEAAISNQGKPSS